MSRERERERERDGHGGATSPPVQRSPGARTLTQRLAGGLAATESVAAAHQAAAEPRADSAPRAHAVHDDPFGFHLPQPVQAKAHAELAPEAVHAHAARGVEGAGQALPHQAAIQAAFGQHDLVGVRAHVGGVATEAATAIGAEAYATGHDVAFAREPDLHTAAHVVQQRAGVQLYGGVGEVGDRYERHADQVADGVVAGQSVEALLTTMVPGGATATPAVQRSPVPSPAGAETGTDIVGALTAPQAATDAYAARHWQALRDAARTALLGAELAWDGPLQWDHSAPAQRAEVALASLWPVVFVREAWDPTFARDVDEAIALGLSIGTARQGQVAADADRLARYHPAVGNAVGNTLGRRLQRSMRAIGADYLAAHEAAGGGAVDTSGLPVSGVSDRAAVALLAFARVMGPVNRPRPQPARGRAKPPRATAARDDAATTTGVTDRAGAAPTAETAVERVNEQLILLAGLVGESNIDALAPAYAFVADGPGASPDTWHETVVRQGERLELIRDEVLALVFLTHHDVAPALKADALAAYARAAGGAHEANATRLLQVARAEVADLDRRAAMAAAQAEAQATEARDPSKVAATDVDAVETRADRATRGERTGAEPSKLAEASTVGSTAGGSVESSPTPRDDARASRVAAFRQGALRLGDALADARAALASAGELVGGMFTASLARDVEALGAELASVEGILHELVEDVMARTGSGVALVEDDVIAEADARFRAFIEASRVMDLGRQVHAMLARVERAVRILATIGFVLLMIGTSVVGGLAGSAVGGAVRGALTVAGGEAGTGAVVAGVTASVLTESLVVGGVQTALAGDAFVDAAGENLLAAGLTFGALTGARWIVVQARAKGAWAGGAVTRFLGPGALDLAVGMGANLTAHSLLHPDAPASDDQLVEWTTAAASMVIGRWIGTRLTGLHQRLDAFGARHGQRARWAAELDALHGEVTKLQGELTSRTRKPEDYDALLDGRIAPLVERIALLERSAREISGHGPGLRSPEADSSPDQVVAESGTSDLAAGTATGSTRTSVVAGTATAEVVVGTSTASAVAASGTAGAGTTGAAVGTDTAGAPRRVGASDEVTASTTAAGPTKPSADPNAAARPSGRPKRINAEDAPENIAADTRENETAAAIARAGYQIEHNPRVAGIKNPDYLIEGQLFDNYSPTTSSARAIWSTILAKVEDGQARRFVLTLDGSGVPLEALRTQFTRWKIEGLEQVLVVKAGQVSDFWP